MQRAIDSTKSNYRIGQSRGWFFPAAMQTLAGVKQRTQAAGTALRRVFEKLNAVRSSDTNPHQMRLVDSLPLGNRRQLLLVVCDNQRYLVGAGADSVGSILAVEPGTVSHGGALKGPELVRRRYREVGRVASGGLGTWR